MTSLRLIKSTQFLFEEENDNFTEFASKHTEVDILKTFCQGHKLPAFSDDIQNDNSWCEQVTTNCIDESMNILLKINIKSEEQTNIEGLGSVNKNDFNDFFEQLPVGPSCQDCGVTYERVKQISDLKRGDHIRFHRTVVGFNMYNHHAIVTDVKPCIKGTAVRMTLVHFQKDYKQGRIMVLKNTNDYNINKEVIDIVKYTTKPFNNEEIIKRANSVAKKFEENQQAESYRFIGNNCEHKSNEIVTGEKFSKQQTSFSNYVKSVIAWIFKLLLTFAIKYCTQLGPTIRQFAQIAVIASLLLIVDSMAMLKYKFENKKICFKCYNKEYRKLQTSLLFCLLSIGISLMYHSTGFYLFINTSVVAALPFVSSFVTDTIMPLIQPASKIPKPVVQQSKMITNGDVITFLYKGFYHEGIATEVSGCDSDHHDVQLTLVHFSYQGLFGIRTVTKEDFFFNLLKDNVYVYDFEQAVYSDARVVDNALDKIGQQNFSSFYYRSSHMSRHCKTGTTQLLKLASTKATDISQFSPGNVIAFKYLGLTHEAVVIKVAVPEIVKCKVVHYKYAGLFEKRTVVEEDISFKPADQNVFVHDYTGMNVNNPDDVVKLARSKVNEQKFNIFTNRSSHLAKYCKIKE